MRFHHIFKDMVKHKKIKEEKKGNGPVIQWWQLSLIGIGSIIGAGFFLGTGLSIKTAGPSVIIGYLVASIAAFFTFTALAEMTVNDPQKGSFRTYAKKAYGRMFGFVSGWMYWFAGLLIMSSEITALSTFSKFWFNNIPIWIFSIIYSLLGLGIILLGVKNFGRIESFFAIVKLSTLIIFVIVGALIVFRVAPGGLGNITPHSPMAAGLFPNGFRGFWTAMIFILFSFGGIAVVGVAANELKNKDEVPKAGYSLMIMLTIVYIAALLIVLSLAAWGHINESQSPFVTALSHIKIPYLSTIFNAILISAAFSTMVGALYSITNVLVSLAEDHDAPLKFAQKNSRDVPLYALLLTAGGISITIILSFLLPKTVYEYLTTAAGVMLILNWSIIITSELKNRPTYQKTHYHMPLHPFSNYLALGIIAFTIIGALFRNTERVGVIIAFSLVVIITGIYWAYSHLSNASDHKEPSPHR